MKKEPRDLTRVIYDTELEKDGKIRAWTIEEEEV